MKRLLIVVILALSCQGNEPGDGVYICVSSTAYAYHERRGCRGLGRCTHSIKKVTRAQAEKRHRSPCGYCSR